MSRRTRTSRDVNAGCFVCGGSDSMWTGGSAQGTAAQHHDRTGHETWADVYMSVRYGGAGSPERPPTLDRKAIVEAVKKSDPVYQAAGEAIRKSSLPLLTDLLKR